MLFSSHEHGLAWQSNYNLGNSGIALLQGFSYEVLHLSLEDGGQRKKKGHCKVQEKAECLLFWDTAVSGGWVLTLDVQGA